MPFNLIIKKDISHLDNALSNIQTEKTNKIDFITYFCRFIFVHSIKQVPGNIYCLKIITTHVDDVRTFNITKIIKWMITSL